MALGTLLLVLTTLPEIFGALVSDALSGVSVPGGSVAAEAVKHYRQRRAEDARDVLLDELRAGEITPPSVTSRDDLIGVTIRYLRAAYEGAARLNLRLLAKAIAGALHRDTLTADAFLATADSLSSLSRQEIIVIGALLHFERFVVEQPRPAEGPWAPPWVMLVEDLQRTQGMTGSEIDATAARAQRSGLIYATSIEVGMSYQVSPLLTKLSETVDFLDALRKEGVSF